MALKIALMGAGGKMGCRITDNIKDLADYEVLYVEVSPAGLANLAKRGLPPRPRPRQSQTPTRSCWPCPTG